MLARLQDVAERANSEPAHTTSLAGPPRANALVQPQAQYNHCDEVASEKCLSAATFVRRRQPRELIDAAAAHKASPACGHILPTAVDPHEPAARRLQPSRRSASE